MKNKFTAIIILSVILTIGLGCNFLQKQNSDGATDDSSTSKQNNDSTTLDPNKKTGVAECDEFIDLLDKDSQSPDEDFVTKKIREYAIDFAKEAIKKNIEENKGDTAKIAQGCKEAKDDYLKNKAEKDKEKTEKK
jgi:hypothetical protein